MKLFKLFFILSIINLSSYGQSLDKNIKKANGYFNLGEYANAIIAYQQALRKEPTKFLIERLANCHRLLNQSQEAEFYYQKIISGIPDSNSFYYALMLIRNEKYREARKVFKELNVAYPEDKTYSLHLTSCDSAITWIKTPSSYKVVNLHEINSSYSDITAVEYKEGIVFASNREEIIIKKKSGITNEPFYNLYIVNKNTKGDFKKPKLFSPIINSIHHETAPSFTADHNKIFFTRVTDYQGKANNSDIVNRPKLFSSEYNNSQWSKPLKFFLNDSLNSFGHPSIESYEKMFFFASDIPGGYGGTDIYVCFNIDNKWTNPLNLGPVINTAGNELYPFYHSDGTLYFASNGHIGMGGFDIYKAIQENGDWKNINNLKPPINSSSDDFSLYFNVSRDQGFFSSNRPRGIGEEDIYLILQE